MRQLVSTKCDSLVYYKVRQVLLQSATAILSQSATVSLLSATGIAKCDDYYKVRQNNE